MEINSSVGRIEMCVRTPVVRMPVVRPPLVRYTTTRGSQENARKRIVRFDVVYLLDFGDLVSPNSMDYILD